jgi:acyl-CoA reductase-like NAD-dependent aldehyde dehydrogenase
MFIDGKWRDAESGKTFESFNPATGEPVGKIPAGEAIDATKAIDAAERAFQEWSSQTA